MNLPKLYEPKQYEADIYTLWEASGAFEPKGDGKPFSIVMPPPNANGNLHLGHSLMNATEDILIRYHRMKGDRTLYIPGADHAGFETWVVYERQLEKQGKSRFDFTRDELYNQVWDFVAKNRGNMEIQLRELGASCDWSKQVFTLDNTVVKTAYQTFKKLWDAGLVYRGKRLVNYCTKHQTSFADIEIEYEDRKTPMYYLKYGPFELATTRPETKFGDTAVAVHPDDERYKEWVGKDIEVEGVNGPFTVKVVADEMVDREFGTGVVKITPAHDFNDWEVAQRHNLPAIEVINKQGLMTEKAGRFAGLTVIEAREAVAKAMEEQGMLLNIDTKYKNRVGLCYKCGTVIEPMLMDQWFVKVAPLVEKAIATIEQGEIIFTPENKGRVLVNYLKNLKDWNISRQIPWGIPVPAFQNTEDPGDWIFDDRVNEEQLIIDGKTYRRDADTFDTWFSSGQWPFITTKYQDDPTLKEFFPNSVMETGADILFAWVARMIMLSLYREDSIPFKDVYLHGMVLDPHGQKMSKSKGNVINPQEIMEEFGSDALRMGIIASRSAGLNQAFGKDKVIAGRNFCNKLWNIARYIEGVVGDDFELRSPKPQSPADNWIIRELDATASQVASLLEEYRFAEAFEAVYHTIWDKMADWYLEASKTALEPSTMVWALEMCLKIAHPFAPFVTETIWQTLKWEDSQVITNPWPTRTQYNEAQAEHFEQLQKIIVESREVLGVIGSTNIAMLTNSSQLILENADLVKRLTKVGLIQITEEGSGLRLTSTHEHVWLDLDTDQITKYATTLKKKLADIERSAEVIESRLSSERYVQKAPEALVVESREELQTKQAQAEHLKHQLKHL